MTKQSTKSLVSTLPSETDKLRRDKFALLARVGRHKRAASQLHDEAEFWSGTVIETLALLGAAMERVRKESRMSQGDPEVAELMSKHIQLTRRLLGFWPQLTESQERVLKLLDSAGLAKTTVHTADGYVIPSSALILESVGRIIAATKAQTPKQSSTSTTEQSPLVGTASVEQATHS